LPPAIPIVALHSLRRFFFDSYRAINRNSRAIVYLFRRHACHDSCPSIYEIKISVPPLTGRYPHPYPTHLSSSPLSRVNQNEPTKIFHPISTHPHSSCIYASINTLPNRAVHSSSAAQLMRRFHELPNKRATSLFSAFFLGRLRDHRMSTAAVARRHYRCRYAQSPVVRFLFIGADGVLCKAPRQALLLE
jgi:hypothetical protein